MIDVEQELIEKIHQLDVNQKQQVLDFVRKLTQPRSVPLGELIQFARQLDFSPEDLEEMKQFIEDEFERIDWDDWNNPPTLST